MTNYNQRLNGLNPLSYVGVNAQQPADFILDNRPPTSNDTQNVALGTQWLDKSTQNFYILVDLSGNVATWKQVMFV